MAAAEWAWSTRPKIATLHNLDGRDAWPRYVAGLAHLQAGDSARARATFEQLLKEFHPRSPNPITALAQLQLARSAHAAGDLPTARRWYQDFLALWKDADEDLPILVQAKAEARKVESGS